MRTFLPAICGAALVVAGLVILKINPPLPQAFGGSFHGNIKELSALADATGIAAILAGIALLAVGPLASAVRRRMAEGSRATAEPTSRAPSRRSPRSG
jgi:uncharacterized membrane protein YidH (DUF202 family)